LWLGFFLGLGAGVALGGGGLRRRGLSRCSRPGRSVRPRWCPRGGEPVGKLTRSSRALCRPTGIADANVLVPAAHAGVRRVYAPCPTGGSSSRVHLRPRQPACRGGSVHLTALAERTRLLPGSNSARFLHRLAAAPGLWARQQGPRSGSPRSPPGPAAQGPSPLITSCRPPRRRRCSCRARLADRVKKARPAPCALRSHVKRGSNHHPQLWCRQDSCARLRVRPKKVITPASTKQ